MSEQLIRASLDQALLALDEATSSPEVAAVRATVSVTLSTLAATQGQVTGSGAGTRRGDIPADVFDRWADELALLAIDPTPTPTAPPIVETPVLVNETPGQRRARLQRGGS